MGPHLSALDEALAALEAGVVVVVPTETVYGLAARPDHPDAIERIFALKGRPPQRPLQVLAPGAEWLGRWGRPSEPARILAGRFWPGPLTLVVGAGREAPPTVVSGGTIGLRVPAHPVAQELLRRAGPLAATSANRSGEPTPCDVDALRELFGDTVAVYLDGGRIAGPASTVVDLTGSEAVIRREGAIPADDITQALSFGFEAG